MMETKPQLYHLPGFYEPFSAMSHLLGAGVFLLLGVLLLLRGRNNPGGLIYLGIYASSVVLLLTMSTLFHMTVRGGAPHRIVERLDHAAIFILIAGTFTPIHGILFRGWLRWGPLVLIWTAAITAITFKTLFFDDLPEWFGFSLYLTMGWVGGVGGIQIARRYGINFVKPLLLGGIAYSVGGMIDFLQWLVLIPGVIHPHELLHMAVLMGAFWHWVFVWQFATGEPSARRKYYGKQTLAHDSNRVLSPDA